MADNAARYLGFAFASAELLFELDGQGRIVLALGATQKLVGLSQEQLIGQPWARLFAPDSRPMASALLEGLEGADRRGPVRVELAPPEGRKLRRYAALSACRLPQLAPNISCAVSLSGGGAAVDLPGPYGMHNQAGFLAAADSLMASPPGMDLDVAFVEFGGLARAVKALDPAAAKASLIKVAAAVQAESLGGQAAGQLADERFALVRPKTEPPDHMLRRLNRAAERAGLAVEATGSVVDFNPAPAGQSMRALKFALDSFIADGPKRAGSAFAAVLAETNAQARAFSQMVAEKRFRLVYQPIVSLKTGDLHHFEVLSRLTSGDASPASAIRMAEELDLIHELDISVADQALRKLAQKEAGLKLAINLSARSLLRPGFVENLLSRAQAFPQVAGRLIFEVTESAAIDDLEAANTLIQVLRSRGFPVCLDDFGAGAAALSYLRALSVDTVKIDGEYIRDVATAGRADAVVRHLTELCRELEVATVAEMVETEKAAAVLKDIGVDYGQGWLFGRPSDEPVFAKASPIAARRTGAVESWS